MASEPVPSTEPIRLADGFELDIRAFELRRAGKALKLERIPMELLLLLVERRGELVTHDQIVERIWGKEVFLDTENSIRAAVRKIRQVLKDDPERPRFVVTVTGKGYRFVAPIESVSVVGTSGPSSISMPPSTRANAEPLATRTSITVLPFKILGRDSESQYIADGLTDETASCLARVDPERLRVKGRTVAYSSRQKSIADIGRQLSADYLVEGSIRVEGERFRVTVALVRVRDQEHIWSETYERQSSSLFGLQQELSAAIAERIRLRLSFNYLNEIAHRQTQNADAYDAYLRGRYFEHQRTPEGNERAVRYYERAVTLDADYALAWSSLAFTHAASAINSDAPPCEVAPRARDAASRALRANPNLAETQFIAAYISFLLDWDWNAAEAGFQRAILLDNSCAASYRHLGHTLSQMKRKAESESAMQRARQLDPLDPMNYALSAQVAFQNRDFSAALAHARQSILLDSTLWIGYMQLAQAYEQIGQYELALEALADAARLSGANSKPLSLRGYLLAKIGRADEARQILKTLQSLSRERYVPPYAMALVHAGFGEYEAVFERLDMAYAARDIHLVFLPVDPKWDSYRSAPRLQSLLAQCSSRALASRRVMLAVLPFENLSGDPAQEYFSDGLTEETISYLGRINPDQIGVIARTSSMAYKRTTKNIRQIGAELGVDFALESSVRREGNRVRVTSQLIRVADQTHVWASTYDREGAGFLAIQDELGRAIAHEVQVKLTLNTGALPRPRPQDTEAHDFYLRGRYHWNTRTGEGFRKAVEYFRLATEREPDYAQAYAGLADAYLLMSGYSVVPRTETIAQARAAAGKALELDATLAEPHASLGLIAVSYDYDWSGAEREYREAIRLNPNHATAHQWYGQYLALVERFDEALEEMRRAQTLDPVSPVISTNTGEVHYLARRYDDAIEQFRKALEVCPTYFRAETWLARAYGQKKMFKEALAHLSNPRRLDDTPYAVSFAGYAYALTGERKEAQSVLIELEGLSKRQYVDPALIAIVYLELGDRDQAFAWLEQAFLDHSPRLTALKVSPEYDPLRSDARFVELLRRVGLSR